MTARKRTKYIHEGGRYVESLDGPPDADIEDAWIAEAKRRHQELLDGRVKGIPGEQVFANVRALLAR